MAVPVRFGTSVSGSSSLSGVQSTLDQIHSDSVAASNDVLTAMGAMPTYLNQQAMKEDLQELKDDLQAILDLLTPPIQETVIDLGTAGDSVVVTGVAGTIIRVYAFWFEALAAVDFTWKNGSGAGLHPPLHFTQYGSWDIGRTLFPCFTLTAGYPLIANLSGVAQVSGRLFYTQT